MHGHAMERAKERLAEANAERPAPADVSALLERTHRQLVELSTAEDLFVRPLHPYTQALLSANPEPVPGRKP